MNSAILSKSIEFLKGVGPKRAELLKQELNIYTYQDLLHHYPFRYVDRSKFHKISELHPDVGNVQLKIKILSLKEVGIGRNKRLTAIVEDGTGEIELIWFKGIKWIKSQLQTTKNWVIYGSVKMYGKKMNMAHPEMELLSKHQSHQHQFYPVYHSTEKLNSKGLNSKGIGKIVETMQQEVAGNILETLSAELIQELQLISKQKALEQIHFPTSVFNFQRARFRLKFEELFFVQLQLLVNKRINLQKNKGFDFQHVGKILNTFYKEKIPFELTNAQKRVVKEIRKDFGSGKQMNRMLQGDVGSGKTLVALLAILIAIDNGFQACLMAPTEILAIQHYHSISEMLEGMDISVALLTGSTKKSERDIIHENLENGILKILIGTHALIENKVQFKNLGFVVIDEQHRFGVAQRAKLWKKNSLPPHVLVMTATPIPRTLAMTLYGDLDTSVLDEMPPGRKPITTTHRFDSARLNVFQFMENEIKKGRQVYVVYPLIEESEKLDYKDLMDGYESISKRFPLPNYRVSIVHGKMKPKDKEYEMQKFASGKTHIMVATTVIEVGVNVPNASLMVIESAEKFGLSQLHQLRGRVGRGSDQSYCILMSGNKLSEDARTRLKTMTSTNDGFKISEVDLKLRGPGDIMGTRQSGLLDFKIADLTKDGEILTRARQTAIELLKNDPNLSQTQSKPILVQLNKLLKNKMDWSKIA